MNFKVTLKVCFYLMPAENNEIVKSLIGLTMFY